MLKAYPLNDTDYTATDAQLYTATRTSGVYADNHFNISVNGTDNDVTIKPGMGWMKLAMFQGIAVANDEDFTINAGVPDSVLPRIDAIVYAYDANANEPEIIIKQGEKGTTPTPPAVVRDDFRHELHLYHIRRRPGATAITPGDITDLRMDANYCGLMADSVTQVDMSAINAQVREFITDWENQIANVTDGKMIEAPEYPGCYYRMNRGVKEWLNPPMMEDEEYPTTKRQDGKRVYTKLLKARMQAGRISLPGVERIVNVVAVAERVSSDEKLMFQLPTFQLPPDKPVADKLQVYYQDNTIFIQAAYYKGMFDLYVTAEYTKPGEEAAYTNVTADGDNINVETNGNVSAQGDNLNVEMFTTVSADGGTYIRRLTINGVAYDLAVGQAGNGAPGTAYPGVPGQFYTDLDSGEVYVCMGGSADIGVYIWRTIIPPTLSTSGVSLKHKTGINSTNITASQESVRVTINGKDTRINGVASPVDENDVANKEYVDSKTAYPDWSRYKLYVMGDSQTAQDNEFAATRYYDLIRQKTGINLAVDGVGGTGYAAGYSTETSFEDRIKTIPEDVDIVTIWGSANDIRYAPDRYDMAIYNTLSWIRLARPTLRVIVVPPAPVSWYDRRSEEWTAYCDRLELCAWVCGCHYVRELYDSPPFDPALELLGPFFSTDPEGVHINDDGHRAIAPFFYNALLQELAFKL